MFGKLGIWEIVLIVVLALILFGGTKLKGVGAALGQSIREFKKELKKDESAAEAEENAKEDKAE